MSVRVPVNPEIIRWAAHRTHDPETLVEKNPAIARWMTGELQPTWKQLQDFARKVGTPFGYFFLEHIPERRLPISDFREGFGPQAHEDSAELWAVLNICQRRQDWYKEYATELGLEPIEVVGIAANWSAEHTAAHMRQTLGFDVEDRHVSVDSSTNSVRNYLIAAFEELGGLAVFNSMVNDNSHRKLDPNEFRGFSLVDPVAPLVFVNAAQTLNGQIFTFAHELAHIWRGQGALGNAPPDSTPKNDVERWCNDVAKEFLTPLNERFEHRLGSNNASTCPRRLRIGDRLSRAVINEFRAGTLGPTHALELTGFKRIEELDSYLILVESQSLL